MNRISSARFVIWVWSGWLVLGSAFAGGLGDWLFSPAELQAITVTDFTPAGRQHRLPTLQQPIYYAGVSAGYRDFGGIMAGEHPISRELVNQTVLKVLAKQGYLPMTTHRSPDIVLLWTWGTMNVERFTTGSSDYTPQINEAQMVQFLGGSKLGIDTKFDNQFPELSLTPGILLNNGPRRDLVDVAHDNLYVVAIAAYDTKLGGDGRGVLLWNTRISCPSRGFWLPDALPAMVVLAGPCIGRETDKPVWVKATDRFKPEVKLGDLKIVEYLESGKAGVVNTGTSN